MMTQSISTREYEVLYWLAFELNTKEIASKLFISPHTVVSHRKKLLAKLGARNTAGLVRVGFERGYLAAGQSYLAFHVSLYIQKIAQLQFDKKMRRPQATSISRYSVDMSQTEQRIFTKAISIVVNPCHSDVQYSPSMNLIFQRLNPNKRIRMSNLFKQVTEHKLGGLNADGLTAFTSIFINHNHDVSSLSKSSHSQDNLQYNPDSTWQNFSLQPSFPSVYSNYFLVIEQEIDGYRCRSNEGLAELFHSVMSSHNRAEKSFPATYFGISATSFAFWSKLFADLAPMILKTRLRCQYPLRAHTNIEDSFLNKYYEHEKIHSS